MTNYRQHVFEFATALVMRPSATANAPKIKPYGSPTALCESPRKRLHHFVVHGAAKERVRMSDDHHAFGLLGGRILRHFY